MDEKVIDIVLSKLDDHSDRLLTLSNLVHSNAGILGLITKIVMGIIMFIIITSFGVLYTYMKDGPKEQVHSKNNPNTIVNTSSRSLNKKTEKN